MTTAVNILLAGLDPGVLFKMIQVLLISSIKFVFAPLISAGYGFSYLQTAVITTIGGISGVLFFYFISRFFVKLFYKYCPIVISYFTQTDCETIFPKIRKRKTRKFFTRKNKLIIRVRNQYGYLGIIALTPVLLSIPIGSFLAGKYYSHRKNLLIHMSLSVIFWSFLISTVFFLF
ncbi:MAG: hypothetical protein JXA03_05680 [Bacteroidales bacterium]|nr:hypothetical protein [Bacteroidales bacterium]